MELLVRWFVDGVLACLGHLQDGTWNYTPSFFSNGDLMNDVDTQYGWSHAFWWLKVGRNQQLGIPQVAIFFQQATPPVPTRPSFLVRCVEYLRCSSCAIFFIWWSLAWTWGQRLASSQVARGQLSVEAVLIRWFKLYNKCLHWDHRTTAKQIEVTSFFMDNQVFISDLSHEKKTLEFLMPGSDPGRWRWPNHTKKQLGVLF